MRLFSGEVARRQALATLIHEALQTGAVAKDGDIASEPGGGSILPGPALPVLAPQCDAPRLPHQLGHGAEPEAALTAKRQIEPGRVDGQPRKLPERPLEAGLLPLQCRELRHRPLAEPVVLPEQLPRAAHLMDPAIGDGGLAHLVLLRQPQPAEQQATALAVQGALRGIKLEAPVQLVEGPVLELLAVEIPRQPAALIEVAVILPHRGNPLGAADQHMLIPQGEEVRALPHIAKVPETTAPAAGDGAHQRPGIKRVAAIEQHLTLVVQGARSQHHQPLLAVVPHLGVAHMAAVALGQIEHGAQLVETALTVGAGQTLEGGAAAIRVFDVAGVDEGQAPLLVAHRRPRIAAVTLIDLGGQERHRLVLPVQQIGRGDVAPALVAVLAAERIPLVEEVVAPVVLDKAVGVVEQPHRGCQVPAGPMGIGRRLELSGQQGPDNLVEEISVLHHSTLYLSR
ncbi:hypothetical protein D3C72_879340 [compost metagenome]